MGGGRWGSWRATGAKGRKLTCGTLAAFGCAVQKLGTASCLRKAGIRSSERVPPDSVSRERLPAADVRSHDREACTRPFPKTAAGTPARPEYLAEFKGAAKHRFSDGPTDRRRPFHQRRLAGPPVNPRAAGQVRLSLVRPAFSRYVLITSRKLRRGSAQYRRKSFCWTGFAGEAWQSARGRAAGKNGISGRAWRLTGAGWLLSTTVVIAWRHWHYWRHWRH